MLTDLQAVLVLSFAPVIGKPYEGKLHVRFDEGALETEHGGKGDTWQSKEPGMDSLHLNHRASALLYRSVMRSSTCRGDITASFEGNGNSFTG